MQKVATTSSSMTGAMPTAHKQPQPTGRGKRCSNNSYQADYTSFKELGLPIKEVRDKARAAGKHVPNNSQGVEFCLSYHVLGFCWNNCGKAGDHQPHLVPDTTHLKAWCSKYYRAEGPTSK
jgi:hypothetical protein